AELAKRSRGTPRIANRLLKRLRDFAAVESHDASSISFAVTERAFHTLEIDAMGFDWMDRKVLHSLIHTFQGGPVGVDTLASAVGEESVTLEEVHEPFLLQQGFIARTPRGRIATLKTYQ